MNSPKIVSGPIKYHEIRRVDFSDCEPSITITHHGVSIPESGNWIYMDKDEAILAAKGILLAYDVPFCNRVKGAGVDD